MLLAPGVDGADEGREALASLAEGVFHVRRDLGIDPAGDERIFFQLAQRLDEHLLAHRRNEPFELPVAFLAVGEMPEENSFPLSDDHPESLFYGTFRFRRAFFHRSI